MKILIACEYSGQVRDRFTEKGHDVMSCDLLPSDTEGLHYQGNVLNILNDGWDMLIGFPPCTHLSCSGARWFKNKQKEQKEAVAFVKTLWNAPIPKIAIENPVGVLSSKMEKPTQYIQPYQYGDPYRKKTCLWLKNLPKLKPTNIVEPKIVTYKNGKTYSADYGVGFNTKHGHRRSKTYPGIAKAMSEQWPGTGRYQSKLGDVK